MERFEIRMNDDEMCCFMEMAIIENRKTLAAFIMNWNESFSYSISFARLDFVFH